MRSLNPYLNFPGTAEEAFILYRSVFGGEFAAIMRFADMPPGGGPAIPAEHRRKIMHIALPLPGGGLLMGSDAVPGMGPPFARGNHVALSIDAESAAEVDRLFAGLSAGGSVQMPPQRTFWAASFAMCTDRFGIGWMLNLAAAPGA